MHPTHPMTVGKALDDWLRSRINTIGPNTERDYRRALLHQLEPFIFPAGLVDDEDFVKPALDEAVAEHLSLACHLGGPRRRVFVSDGRTLGNLLLSSLDDLRLNAIRQAFLEQGLGVKRVNNLMAPLRGAIQRQVRLGALAVNPFDLLEPLRASLRRQLESSACQCDIDEPLPGEGPGTFSPNEGDPDPLTMDELKAILPKLEGALANQVLFACWTGLRTGELIGLRLSDLQLERNRFLVRRSVSRGILKSTKTDKQRWVDLLPPARAAVEAQVKLIGATSGWLFPNPFTGQRWANDSKITRRWKKALAAAGVRYRRPYQTRHTYASMMLSSGENPLYVAQQMGHADWSMLVKVYARWLPSSAATHPGKLVGVAHAADWSVLMSLVAAKPT